MKLFLIVYLKSLNINIVFNLDESDFFFGLDDHLVVNLPLQTWWKWFQTEIDSLYCCLRVFAAFVACPN